jgi:hypothetical protein
MRTTSRVVTFSQPFMLQGFDAMQPAGAYVVETDEEPIEGVSVTAYRRVATWIVLPSLPGRPGVAETVAVDPAELEQALARDAAV